MSTDTPMMQQYRQTKAENPDCLLFMRMGDFFELFLDDAVEAAKLLGITLTSRNKNSADAIPMAGVPHHSLEQHLPKLLAAGKKVAIMDQLEDPKQAKGLVKRGLTRIISAGTLIDESALEDGSANFLVALNDLDGPIGIAALDCSTGHFVIEQAEDRSALALALARLSPAEVIIPDDWEEDRLAALRQLMPPGSDETPLTTMPGYAWRAQDARLTLSERFRLTNLEVCGISHEDDHLVSAAAAALRYSEQHARLDLGHVQPPKRLYPSSCLVLDATCRRNLELLRNSRDGGRQGSLFATIDKTRTAAGARLLQQWLNQPLAEVAGITQRHDAVQRLLDDDGLRSELRQSLDAVYDLERLVARIATGRANGRDLVQLANSHQAAHVVQQLLTAANHHNDSPQPLGDLLQHCLPDLAPCMDLQQQLHQTLVDEPPLTISEGGLIRDGIDQELDDLRAIKQDANTWLAQYQAKESERSGIPKIKVGYNKVFGYYLEVSKAHSDKVPADFIRKQTLVNAERYITPELKRIRRQSSRCRRAYPHY